MIAAPFITLGIFSTISLTLYIVGCVITKNWYPMFTIIPALFCLILALILMPLLDETNYSSQEGCAVFTADSTTFLLVVFGVSAVMLPIVFYHTNVINAVCLGMHLGGDASILIGFILYAYIDSKVNSSF